MSRRFSPFFSIFRVFLSLLLMHLLVELSTADSEFTSKQMYCMHKKMDEKAKKSYKSQYSFAKDGRVIKSCSRTSDSSMFRNRYMDPTYHKWEQDQMQFEMMTDYMMKKNKKSYDDAQYQNMTSSYGYSRKRREYCLKEKQTAQCDEYARYRTADGSCNNIQHPTWGSTKCCQERVCPAYYEGSSGFRRSVKGGPLPEPRDLSLHMHNNVDRPTYEWTHMFVFFGQFVDHEITFTPTSTTVYNQAIQCCPPKKKSHPQCKPIRIRKDDPFYSKYNVTCLNFVRSAVCNTCSYGYRVPPEQVTSFVDGSLVYGNSDKETDKLRKKDGTGQLKYQQTKCGPLMPRSFNPHGDHCSFPKQDKYCFQAGDTRANQHPELTSLQTLFFREHNRLCKELLKRNPHWDGETTFQEARRIVGAEMQSMCYNEYLPIVLDPKSMNYYKLYVGYPTKYDPQVKPCMEVEFTTAAFRFGHSLINTVMANYQSYNGTQQHPKLRDNFNYPFSLYDCETGPWLRGASYSKPQKNDQWMVDDVTDYLYRPRGMKFGSDLAATNIQRGRDHGICPYVDLVEYCSYGKIKIRSFDDLKTYYLMKPEQVEDLKKNYKDVRDVDAWTALIMEIPKDHAVVGPTSACIIAQQFYKIKYGDRFYFEHYNVPNKFSEEQINEIRRFTLSDCICLNTDVRSMPRNAMLFTSYYNPEIRCEDVKGINLDYWKEKPYYTY